MKAIIFSVLLAGAATAAYADDEDCISHLKTVEVGVDGTRVFLFLKGQPAKDIFDGMPESSRLKPKDFCYAYLGIDGSTNRRIIMKVQGGFVCEFNDYHPICGYRCSIEISSKTGKVLMRSKNDVCEPNP